MVFWGSRFATLTRRIQNLGAKCIAFDLVMQADVDSYMLRVGNVPEKDLPLRQWAEAITEWDGNVFLANYRDSSGQTVNPAPFLALLIPDQIGFVDLPLSADGAVRRLPFRYGDADAGPLSLSALVASRYLEDSGKRLRRPLGPHQDRLYINYTGVRQRTLEASTLLRGNLDPGMRDAIRGAIVVVGYTAPGSADLHPTPIHRLDAGLNIQAEAMQTWLGGRPLVRWPRTAETVACLLAGLLYVRVLGSRRIGSSLIVVACLMTVWTMACVAAFAAFDQLWPLAPLHISALGCTLVVMALSRIEAAAETSRIRAVFGRQVSDRVRDYLIDRPDIVDGRGVETEATILFLDIRGSTAMAEATTPEAHVEALNSFYEAVLPSIDRFGGMTARFMGDGIMALFGVPCPTPHHAQAAVDAAMSVRGTLDRLNSDRAARGLPPWRIACSIHTGRVIQGNVGARHRQEFTAIGDAVNVASRLENLCKQMGCQLVVSGSTYDLLDCKPNLEGPCEVELAGRREPISIYHDTADSGVS